MRRPGSATHHTETHAILAQVSKPIPMKMLGILRQSEGQSRGPRHAVTARSGQFLTC
jgi:hypothetical protein